MNDTTTTVDPHESLSLAEHEATYGGAESPAPAAPQPEPVPEPQPEPEQPTPDGDKPEPVNTDPARGDRDEHGRFKPKHRAASQRATAADVPRINELTKKYREAEERAKLAEQKARELEDRLKAPPARPIPEPPKDFTDAEPKYEDFANEPDQYAAWMRAVTAYDRKRESFEQQKTAHSTAKEAEIKARNEQRDAWFKEKITAHGARMEAFHQKNPQAQAIIDQADVYLNPVMLAAVITAENSPELMLRLAQDQELVDDLHVLTDDKQPSQDLVAYVQRRMNRGKQVATTGSTAPAPVVPALPRPPNPVRTGVMKPADTPPGEEASLADHERAYGSGGRRRR